MATAWQKFPNNLPCDGDALLAYFLCRKHSSWETGELRESLPKIAAAGPTTMGVLKRGLGLLAAAGFARLLGPHGSQRWWLFDTPQNSTPTEAQLDGQHPSKSNPSHPLKSNPYTPRNRTR